MFAYINTVREMKMEQLEQILNQKNKEMIKGGRVRGSQIH